MIHQPVMVQEVVEYCVSAPLFQAAGARGESVLVIDATLGEGGHAEAFFKRDARVRIQGIDADPVMAGRAAARLDGFRDRLRVSVGWFDEFLSTYRGEAPAAVLFDLGISMYHLKGSDRGFTFFRDEELDMRLGETDETAADLVNGRTERELADIIFTNGEERFSRYIAAAIVRERGRGRITGTARLAEIVALAVPPAYRHGRIHAATRTFQALRIAVNDELGRIDRALGSAWKLLGRGGRMAAISFHSLEDRIVKRFFREFAHVEGDGKALLLTKKPVEPTPEEIAGNPASRSAKLRVVEKPG
jgi:16S rRNA (cytosine1402-N4)-methyltransferase